LLNNYFTLFQLAKELDAECFASSLEEIFTQHKNELVITFSKNSIERSIVVRCEAKNNHIYFREKFLRAKKNTLAVFPELVGEKVERIFLHNDDRILVMELSGKQVWCAMFGAKANIFLLDENKRVLDVFLNDDDAQGKIFQIEKKNNVVEAISFAEFEQHLQKEIALPIYIALKTMFPALGALLAREICFRSNITETTIAETISAAQRNTLYSCAREVIAECQNPQARIYFQNNKAKEFSLIALKSFCADDEKIFSTINEGIRAYVSFKRKESRFSEIQHSLLSSLKSNEAKISRSLQAIAKQRSENSKVKEYQYRAKILLANLSLLRKGMNEVTLSDFENSALKIVIPLEEKLSPVENAERYFEKAKHAKRAYEELEKRRCALALQTKSVEELIALVSSLKTSEELKDFMNAKESEWKKLGISKPAELEEEKIPFRVFTVNGGYEVWAGKNSASNDELTLHYSQPNDLWFHARGGGGSHVVLKVQSKQTQVSKEAIMQTASIAAYYSKMRKAKNVPVAYCERKYVRKPKGVKEGTVYIEREKVIFVEPTLPYEETSV